MLVFLAVFSALAAGGCGGRYISYEEAEAALFAKVDRVAAQYASSTETPENIAHLVLAECDPEFRAALEGFENDTVYWITGDYGKKVEVRTQKEDSLRRSVTSRAIAAVVRARNSGGDSAHR